MRTTRRALALALTLLLSLALPGALAAAPSPDIQAPVKWSADGFLPRTLEAPVSARLDIQPADGETAPAAFELTDPEGLRSLHLLLKSAERTGEPSCSFSERSLTLSFQDGRTLRLELPDDACTYYRAEGAVFSYVPAERCGAEEKSLGDNRLLYGLFPGALPPGE